MLERGRPGHRILKRRMSMTGEEMTSANLRMRIRGVNLKSWKTRLSQYNPTQKDPESTRIRVRKKERRVMFGLTRLTPHERRVGTGLTRMTRNRKGKTNSYSLSVKGRTGAVHRVHSSTEAALLQYFGPSPSLKLVQAEMYLYVVETNR